MSGVLHALGFLGYAVVRDILWHYVQGGDWHTQRDATLGFLNLPTGGLEHEIAAAVRGCLGRSLFPEFLPALAHRSGDPDLLQLIFDHGRESASTDCNAGIVYGVALYGEAGRSHFDQLLRDPQWEVWCGATGTQWWAYHGFRHLGGRLADLAREVRAAHATLPFQDWEFRARTWLALAESGLDHPLPPIRTATYPRERAVDGYSAAFDWSSPKADDSLTGLSRHDGWLRSETLHAFSVRLADRIAREADDTGPT